MFKKIIFLIFLLSSSIVNAQDLPQNQMEIKIFNVEHQRALPPHAFAYNTLISPDEKSSGEYGNLLKIIKEF